MKSESDYTTRIRMPRGLYDVILARSERCGVSIPAVIRELCAVALSASGDYPLNDGSPRLERFEEGVPLVELAGEVGSWDTLESELRSELRSR